MTRKEQRESLNKRRRQMELGRAYNRGRVNALLSVGKTIPEIAYILKLNESTVRCLTFEKFTK